LRCTDLSLSDNPWGRRCARCGRSQRRDTRRHSDHRNDWRCRRDRDEEARGLALRGGCSGRCSG
jgi:hypothetical protein